MRQDDKGRHIRHEPVNQTIVSGYIVPLFYKVDYTAMVPVVSRALLGLMLFETGVYRSRYSLFVHDWSTSSYLSS